MASSVNLSVFLEARLISFLGDISVFGTNTYIRIYKVMCKTRPSLGASVFEVISPVKCKDHVTGFTLF